MNLFPIYAWTGVYHHATIKTTVTVSYRKRKVLA